MLENLWKPELSQRADLSVAFTLLPDHRALHCDLRCIDFSPLFCIVLLSLVAGPHETLLSALPPSLLASGCSLSLYLTPLPVFSSLETSIVSDLRRATLAWTKLTPAVVSAFSQEIGGVMDECVAASGPLLLRFHSFTIGLLSNSESFLLLPARRCRGARKGISCERHQTITSLLRIYLLSGSLQEANRYPEGIYLFLFSQEWSGRLALLQHGRDGLATPSAQASSRSFGS